ncbi:unnamed protein product [Meloidogyne enterolobii]|uniref:Uncharacterized protein n=1 Tax=Meloidogyne enterolobii TaxID=390850 RepID=A0ACB0YX01_MELEN
MREMIKLENAWRGEVRGDDLVRAVFLGGIVVYGGTVVYGGIKILLSFAMIWGWVLTTLRICRFTHLGTTPTPECKQNENCTICFSEYTSPVKLKCSHIFCSECIRTWLDREHTCPICRTIVTKEDNNYRNGESMFPCIF